MIYLKSNMYTYEITLTHGMFGDYWTVIQKHASGSERVYPYFDTKNDAKAFIIRLKEFNNDYR